VHREKFSSVIRVWPQKDFNVLYIIWSIDEKKDLLHKVQSTYKTFDINILGDDNIIV